MMRDVMMRDIRSVVLGEVDGQPTALLLPAGSDSTGDRIDLGATTSPTKYLFDERPSVPAPGVVVATFRFEVAESVGLDLVDVITLDDTLAWSPPGPPGPSGSAPDVTVRCAADTYHAWRAGIASSQTFLGRASVEYTSVAALSLLAGVEAVTEPFDAERHLFALHVECAALGSNVRSIDAAAR